MPRHVHVYALVCASRLATDALVCAGRHKLRGGFVRVCSLALHKYRALELVAHGIPQGGVLGVRYGGWVVVVLRARTPPMGGMGHMFSNKTVFKR